jgi:hypothetical protein
MPADPMIREASAASLLSSVMSWGLRTISASARIVLLTLAAVMFTCAISVMYIVDLRSTSQAMARRKVIRKNSRQTHASVRRHATTLELLRNSHGHSFQ